MCKHPNKYLALVTVKVQEPPDYLQVSGQIVAGEWIKQKSLNNIKDDDKFKR